MLIAALGADLDFLAGLVFGDVLQFHHRASHSVVVALIGALLVRGVFGGSLPILAALALGHPALDALTADIFGWYPGHRGLSIFWPFSDFELRSVAWFAAPYVGGDFARLFSWPNISVLLFDAGVGSFLAGVCLSVGPRRVRETAR